MIDKKAVLDFIRRHKLGVISTVDISGKPEAAVVEFGQTDQLELIIDTFDSSRKYQNILKNPNVAFVIGWEEEMTVQYEGLARPLSGDELQRYKQIYFEKNPRAKKWESRPGVVYFKIVPRWLRYSDLRQEPWEVAEMDF